MTGCTDMILPSFNLYIFQFYLEEDKQIEFTALSFIIFHLSFSGFTAHRDVFLVFPFFRLLPGKADGVEGGFYLYACILEKAYNHNTRDAV